MINEFAGHRIIITAAPASFGHHMALTLKNRGAEVEVIDSLQVNNLSAFAGNADNISIARSISISFMSGSTAACRQAFPFTFVDARDYQTLSPAACPA